MSTKTGVSPYKMDGFTVVGKPAATVITSSPGISRASPNDSAVNAAIAKRFAEDPELTVKAYGRPKNVRNFFSKMELYLPVVNQNSKAESVRLLSSSAP